MATAVGSADGTDGLQSELDSVALPAGASSFGQGGLYEAGGNAPCYCAGTRLATATGEMAVEALRIGDLVHTCVRRRAANPLDRARAATTDGSWAGMSTCCR